MTVQTTASLSASKTPAADALIAYTGQDMSRPPDDALEAFAELTGYPVATVAGWFASGEDFIGVPETAAILGIAQKQVYELFNAGHIEAKKVGREWRTTPSKVRAWFDALPPE